MKKKRIKIIHVTEDMKIGGQERVIEDILNNLDLEIFEVQLLCLTSGGVIADRLEKTRIKVTILNIENYNSLKSIKKVINWLKNEKIDIVHTHGFSSGVLGRISAYFAGISKIYAHIHTMSDELSFKHGVKEKLLSFISTKIITVSNAVNDSYKKRTHINKKKLIMIYNGLNLPLNREFNEKENIKKRYDIPKDVKIIGSVASLTKHKAHYLLFEAIKNIDNIYIILVGDGIEKMKLAELAIKLGIEKRVRLVGNQEDIFPFIDIMDIFVLSSVREGHPLSLIEAMGFKKPVIATNVGGVSEIIENDINGIIVPPKNSKKIEESINLLLNNEELSKKLGNNGKETYINRFTLKKMMEKLVLLYES